MTIDKKVTSGEQHFDKSAIALTTVVSLGTNLAQSTAICFVIQTKTIKQLSPQRETTNSDDLIIGDTDTDASSCARRALDNRVIQLECKRDIVRLTGAPFPATTFVFNAHILAGVGAFVASIDALFHVRLKYQGQTTDI